MLDTDLDALLDQRHPPAKRCRVCWALEGLPPETRTKMAAAIDGGAPAAALSEAFLRRDWPVQSESIRRHRLRCG